MQRYGNEPDPMQATRPLTNSSRRLGAIKGVRPRSSGQGNFQTPCRLWYWICNTRFAKLNPQTPSVTAGPSGPTRHKTDDATTPESPQWPSRPSGAQEQPSSPERAALWAGAGLSTTWLLRHLHGASSNMQDSRVTPPFPVTNRHRTGIPM